MIIGIDIDDTITKTTELYKEIALKEYPKYKGRIPDGKYTEFRAKYGEYIRKNVLLKEDVLEVLNYIKSKGHQIYIVTLRGIDGEYIIEETKSYLKENKIPYDKIIGGAINKGKVAKENNIDLFIEDRSEVIKDLIKYKIPYIKMYKKGDINFPYTVAKDWKKVLKMLKERNI